MNLNCLLITPDRDRELGDWSGAFALEAKRFCGCHNVRELATRLSVNITTRPAVQRAQVLKRLETLRDLDLVAFFCHGTRRSLQLGWTLTEVPHLAKALAQAGKPTLAVALYACSTAQADPEQPGTAGDGGLADVLRDALGQARPDWTGWVDGHDRAGHTTSNPYVRRMAAGGERGGDWLIAPDSPWWPRWQQALDDRNGSTLRLRFPLLTQAQIEQELA